MKHYALMIGLLAVALGIQTAVPGASGPWAPDRVPETVREAASQGRYWRATRLLEDHLDGSADTTAALVVLAARLHAGWENWPTVRELLESRAWLDTVNGGDGWALLGRARIATGDPEAGARALATYLDVARLRPADRGLAELRQGLALTGAGRQAEALAAFDRAARLVPWFADWAAYLGAAAAARAGEVAEVNRRLEAAGETGPDHWRLRVSAALVAGDTLAAREAALAATRSGTRTARSGAWAELGRLRLASGDTARARLAFGRAMGARGSIGAVEAARRLSELRPGPEEWLSIAEVYERHGNALRAAEGFATYLEAGAGTAAERARVRLQLGRARFNAGRYRQAERGLLALAEDPVPEAIAAEALYLAGRAQYRQGRSGDGRATFLRLAERFPSQEAVTRGLYLLADLQHDDLETDGPRGARTYYRRAVDAAPHLNEAGLALMRLAGLEYLEGDYQGAADIWEEYRSAHPDGRRSGQATYWAARAYQRLGKDSLAEARLRAVRRDDPISFYGVRAAQLLGEPVLDLGLTEAPGRDPRAEARVRQGIRRVDLLAALDRREDLVYEVERLRRRFQEDPEVGVTGEYALAEALNERGYTLTGIGMGWDLYERADGWNTRLLRIIYPFPFRGLVVPEAQDRELDPFLIAGLIRRESAFNPTVVSGAGAIGLMQIVPETGRALGRAAGLRPFHPDLLTRPEVNIHLGTRFFAELLDRYGDDLPLVLAAYNAGPTRANVWRRLPEAEDPELFTERIPYGETRDYVRYVLLHRALYAALYPDIASTAGDGQSPAAGPGDPGGASGRP